MTTEMDLQEKTRMQDTYREIEDIIDKISKMRVGQPLVWVYAWDVARSIWHDIADGGEPEVSTSKTEEEMWEMFWGQADINGFTLEYGTEDLYEAIRDWMIDKDIIEEDEGDEDEDE